MCVRVASDGGYRSPSACIAGTGEQFWEPIVSKATEQNDKLKRAIIISVALHIILIALLIWSSFDEHLDASAGGGGGSSIDAVVVDPGRW